MLNEKQITKIILSWQKIDIESFQINGKFSTGRVIAQRQRLENKSFKDIKDYLETFILRLKDDYSMEKMGEHYNETSDEELEFRWLGFYESLTNDLAMPEWQYTILKRLGHARIKSMSDRNYREVKDQFNVLYKLWKQNLLKPVTDPRTLVTPKLDTGHKLTKEEKLENIKKTREVLSGMTNTFGM